MRPDISRSSHGARPGGGHVSIGLLGPAAPTVPSDVWPFSFPSLPIIRLPPPQQQYKFVIPIEITRTIEYKKETIIHLRTHQPGIMRVARQDSACQCSSFWARQTAEKMTRCPASSRHHFLQQKSVRHVHTNPPCFEVSDSQRNSAKPRRSWHDPGPIAPSSFRHGVSRNPCEFMELSPC